MAERITGGSNPTPEELPTQAAKNEPASVVRTPQVDRSLLASQRDSIDSLIQGFTELRERVGKVPFPQLSDQVLLLTTQFKSLSQNISVLFPSSEAEKVKKAKRDELASLQEQTKARRESTSSMQEFAAGAWKGAESFAQNPYTAIIQGTMGLFTGIAKGVGSLFKSRESTSRVEELPPVMPASASLSTLSVEPAPTVTAFSSLGETLGGEEPGASSLSDLLTQQAYSFFTAPETTAVGKFLIKQFSDMRSPSVSSSPSGGGGDSLAKFAMISALIGAAIIALAPGLNALLTTIAPAIATAITAIAVPLGTFLSIAAPALGQFVVTLLPMIGELVRAVVSIVQQVVPYIIPVLQGILEGIQAIVPPIVSIIVTALNIIKDVLVTLQPAIMVIAEMIVAVIQEVAAIVVPVLQVIGEIIREVVGGIGKVVSVVVGVIGTVISTIGRIITKIAQGIEKFFDDPFKAIRGFIQKIGDFFAGSGFADIFKPLVPIFESIAQGITSIVQAITGVVVSILNSIASGITRISDAVVGAIVTGINSLASVFSGFAGVITSFTDTAGNIVRSIGGLVTNIVNQISSLIGTVSDAITRKVAAEDVRMEIQLQKEGATSEQLAEFRRLKASGREQYSNAGNVNNTVNYADMPPFGAMPLLSF